LPSKRDTYNRTIHYLSLRRQGRTVREAEREAATSARTAWKYLGRAAFRRTKRGLVPRTRDDLERQLLFLFPDGTEFVTFRGSTRASTVGRYWAAVRTYVERGDATALLKFRSRSIIDTQGRRLRFLTDLDKIRSLARTGQVGGFNSIY
jgi:hypothetical protein